MTHHLHLGLVEVEEPHTLDTGRRMLRVALANARDQFPAALVRPRARLEHVPALRCKAAQAELLNHVLQQVAGAARRGVRGVPLRLQVLEVQPPAGALNTVTSTRSGTLRAA